MKTRLPYSYSILRYVHDVATGEFVNIGVAVHCADAGFFEVSCRQTLGRISDFFPDLNTKAYRNLAKLVSKRFAHVSNSYSSLFAAEKGKQDLESILTSVLQKDDSALVWTPVQGGLTTDPRKTITDIYARYVTRYDSRTPTHKRTDEDVWKNFNKALENRHLAQFFVEKTIKGRDDQVKFKSAWKNGIWHCIEPISFDLSASETIREKAHRVLGQITSVVDSSEPFKLYLVLAAPSKQTLRPAFDQAVQILNKMQTEKAIYSESETDALLSHFQHQISCHEGA